MKKSCNCVLIVCFSQLKCTLIECVYINLDVLFLLLSYA
jgi:hypothetical protein